MLVWSTLNKEFFVKLDDFPVYNHYGKNLKWRKMNEKSNGDMG
jgi:hypothetical protein